jgi:hypothetical protein
LSISGGGFLMVRKEDRKTMGRVLENSGELDESGSSFVRRHARCGAAIAAFVVAGCHGCRDDHPYVPYAIGSVPPPSRAADASAPAATASTPPLGSGRSPFAGDPALVAPAGAQRWAIDDTVLQAPEGRVFVSAIVRDFDNDGAKDAFAIVRPAEGNDPGALAYYRGQTQADALSPTAVFPPPAGLSRDPNCAPVDRLVAVGKRSVLAELGATCSLYALGAPDRWVAVVSGGVEAGVRLATTIVDPPGAAALSVDADTTDRDGDTREDVTLRITLEGGGAPGDQRPRVGAVFSWLDRRAGLGRDLAATESSFASLAAAGSARAARSKDAPAVPAYVAQVRALWRAVCADGGSPRVFGVAGTGEITCGAARALEEAGLAEVRAYVTTGDPLRAALALDRAERPPASHAASRTNEAQRWIARLAPVAMARALRAVAAVPVVASGHEPTWGSLAFDPGGKLLVRTRAGVVRVDPDAGDESAADGVPEWKAAVVSPDGGMRWIETYDPCDGLALHATFAPTAGDDLRDVLLPVAPPLGDRCAGSRGAPVRALPIAWGSAGIEAIVDGEPISISPDLARASLLAGFLGQPVTPGAPRSPDGAALVVPTGAGLLVRSAGRARLLRATELDATYIEQRDCAVSNDATRVACVRGSKAWVGTWE